MSLRLVVSAPQTLTPGAVDDSGRLAVSIEVISGVRAVDPLATGAVAVAASVGEAVGDSSFIGMDASAPAITNAIPPSMTFQQMEFSVNKAVSSGNFGGAFEFLEPWLRESLHIKARASIVTSCFKLAIKIGVDSEHREFVHECRLALLLDRFGCSEAAIQWLQRIEGSPLHTEEDTLKGDVYRELMIAYKSLTKSDKATFAEIAFTVRKALSEGSDIGALRYLETRLSEPMALEAWIIVECFKNAVDLGDRTEHQNFEVECRLAVLLGAFSGPEGAINWLKRIEQSPRHLKDLVLDDAVYRALVKAYEALTKDLESLEAREGFLPYVNLAKNLLVSGQELQALVYLNYIIPILAQRQQTRSLEACIKLAIKAMSCSGYSDYKLGCSLAKSIHRRDPAKALSLLDGIEKSRVHYVDGRLLVPVVTALAATYGQIDRPAKAAELTRQAAESREWQKKREEEDAQNALFSALMDLIPNNRTEEASAVMKRIKGLNVPGSPARMRLEDVLCSLATSGFPRAVFSALMGLYYVPEAFDVGEFKYEVLVNQHPAVRLAIHEGLKSEPSIEGVGEEVDVGLTLADLVKMNDIGTDDRPVPLGTPSWVPAQTKK